MGVTLKTLTFAGGAKAATLTDIVDAAGDVLKTLETVFHTHTIKTDMNDCSRLSNGPEYSQLV